MGGGSSTKRSTAEQQEKSTNELSGVFPDDDDDPTPEELKAAEEENERQRIFAHPKAPTSKSSKERQTKEANDLKNEFASSDTNQPIQFNFQAVKELWFHSASGSRGRSLVELKDTVQSLSSVFNNMYAQYTTGNLDVGMPVKDFINFVKTSGTDLDEDAIKGNFFEATAYPDDENDLDQVNAIFATIGQFASAVVRCSNAYIMQEFGESEKGLHEQLIDWLRKFGPAVGVDIDGLDIVCRDETFYQPPESFIGTFPKVYLLLKYGDNEGKLTIELNGQASPKCAYNFKCLCTGERGIGEITGKNLSLKNNEFHRIVKGMCVQAGDIEGGDGYGGESIYGGDFEDESFDNGLSHDTSGIVSMGNQGPNTNSSQFFITLGPCSHLDGENNIFGKVIDGMEHLMKINETFEIDEDDKPIVPIVIKDCGLCT
jgi:cyclophilin family peptidyl-prolyl cis-trans isomerase